MGVSGGKDRVLEEEIIGREESKELRKKPEYWKNYVCGYIILSKFWKVIVTQEL